MGNSTKSNLLFLFLVVLLCSFTFKDTETRNPSSAPNSLSNSLTPFHTRSGSSVIQEETFNSAENTLLTPESRGTLHVKDKLIKYRKKYKRTSNVYSGIRPPSRVVSPVVFSLFSKETYTTPHFLSHLHHFLFRLKPF